MKMPTLRASSGNEPCCPDCRRAFSERSRQPGKCFPIPFVRLFLECFRWLSECFRYHLRTVKLLLHTRFMHRQCLCMNQHQSGSFSRFPKAAPLVVEREFQGGENRNSPPWRIFASFLFVKKGRACPGLRGKPAPAEYSRDAAHRKHPLYQKQKLHYNITNRRGDLPTAVLLYILYIIMSISTNSTKSIFFF